RRLKPPCKHAIRRRNYMAIAQVVSPISEAPPASARPLIRMRGISKTYVTASSGTVHALDGIDVDIREGEFVCVVGPSGCGKSTLLRMLAGLDSYDEGT